MSYLPLSSPKQSNAPSAGETRLALSELQKVPPGLQVRALYFETAFSFNSYELNLTDTLCWPVGSEGFPFPLVFSRLIPVPESAAQWDVDEIKISLKIANKVCRLNLHKEKSVSPHHKQEVKKNTVSLVLVAGCSELPSQGAMQVTTPSSEAA